MKNKLILFVVGSIFLGLWACMDSDDTEYEVSRDPQIASFSLSHDSISGLSDVVFVVDQVNGLIYNPDSMAMEYRELIDSMKVLASIEFTSYVSNIELYPQATMDTVFWTGSTENDSIDFSDRVDIKTTALDGLTTKRYQSKLNIHTVLPDTMVWNLFQKKIVDAPITTQKVLAFNDGFLMYSLVNNAWKAQSASFTTPDSWSTKETDLPVNAKVSQLLTFAGKLFVPATDGTLYSSTDGFNWSTELSGEYVVSILGALTENTLSVVMQNQNIDSIFATLIAEDNGLVIGDQGTDIIPEDFPLDELNDTAYEINNTPTLLVIGGTRDGKFIQKVWNTNNGLKWEAYQNIDFPYRRGAAVTKYDDKLYLIGGFDEEGKPSRDIFISQNRGVAWKESGTLVALPEEFDARGFVSVVVDNEQYMYLFGGKATINGNVWDESWKGRINRLGFAK